MIFLLLAQSLRQALGDLALRIDHIGSTSVPGLAAKDIIDIQITLQSLDTAVEQVLNQARHQRIEHLNQDHLPPGDGSPPGNWVKWVFKRIAFSVPLISTFGFWDEPINVMRSCFEITYGFILQPHKLMLK
jgi:GrpB-like predicted nucleotidyltransferase (UPF0157 family)